MTGADVWKHATSEQADAVVAIWMNTYNRGLGERPVDAVAAGRAGAVLAAWGAYMEGAYP